MIEKVEAAFAHRQMPSRTFDLEGCPQIDSDVEDALWFEGRDWHELTSDDWEKHHCAVIFLSNEAFAYYLPSLLTLTVRAPENCPAQAVDTLVSFLDRTPDMREWDLPFTGRFLMFQREEYEALKEWLLFACEIVSLQGWGIAGSGPGDRFGRAFENVNLLQQAAESQTLIEELGEIWKDRRLRYQQKP